MLRREMPLTAIFSRWFGSWQVPVEPRPLTPEALAAANDRAAPRRIRLTGRLGYARAYRRVFEGFFPARRIDVGARPLRVLERGVATGVFLLALAKAWRRLVALTAGDTSPALVAADDARLRRAGITTRVIQAGVGALPLADASVDLVIAAHVLEHLTEPVAALAEMRRVLRPCGWVVTCMTRQSWLGAFTQAKWRTHRLTPRHVAGWLSAAAPDAAALDEPRRGLFYLTSLNAIEDKASTGIAGKELKP